MYTVNQSRDDLAKLFVGTGAEIGVEQGNFSEIIVKDKLNIHLYCVDPWKPYRAYRDHMRVDKLERFYWRTRKKLYPYNCTILRESSMSAVKKFEDNSLDFVYIDANHAYDYVYQDIEEWSKKVKPGGIVSGHDYVDIPSRGKHYKVKEAVNDFVKKNSIDNLTVYKFDHEYPSWMYYKK